MKVSELREILSQCSDSDEVLVSVEEPPGYWCPGGGTVEVRTAVLGFDWHDGALIVVPDYKLKVKDVDAWSKGAKE